MSFYKNRKALFLTAFLMLTIAIMPVFGDNPPSTPTAITCIVSLPSITLGENLTISGSISPEISNVTVDLVYTKPNSTTLTRSVSSEIDGSFQDVYTPDSIGSWSVKSSWSGNVDYLSSTSFAVTFEVKGSNTVFPVELLIGAITVIIVVVLAGYLYIKRTRKNSLKVNSEAQRS